MWSIGCIFAELLGMMKENQHDHRRRKPLFPGERWVEGSIELMTFVAVHNSFLSPTAVASCLRRTWR